MRGGGASCFDAGGGVLDPEVGSCSDAATAFEFALELALEVALGFAGAGAEADVEMGAVADPVGSMRATALFGDFAEAGCEITVVATAPG